MSVAPFPFDSLPAVSREDLAVLARARAIAPSLVDLGRVAAALSELCDAPVSIDLRRVRRGDAAPVSASAVAAAFTPADAPTMREAVLIELEPTLAAVLVALALRQRAPRIVDTSRAPAPELAGAVAATLHAAFRRAHAGDPLRVAAAGPARGLGRDLAALHAEIATATLTVVIGGDAFDARVHVPVPKLPQARPSARLSIEALSRLSDAPLALPLVACSCVADRADILALRAGDVFVPPQAARGLDAPASLRLDADRLVGPVALVAPASERGLSADLAEGGQLVLRPERVVRQPWDTRRPDHEDAAMTGEPEATLEVLEDAPVVVRVELGVVEMKAREWAQIAPGDVITLGRRLGDPAIIRIGGVEVARGELVQVEGEYGVRILGRNGGK